MTNTIILNENMALYSYYDKAVRAHSWTSHFPEDRARRLIRDYSELLQTDIDNLKSEGIESEKIQSYENRYKNLFSNWLHAKSNCASSFITGGSGFNVRRAEKANRSEQRHYELWQEWRIRAIKAIIRKEKPVKTYKTELERYKAELEGLKAKHELMKEGNKRIAKAIKTGEDLTDYLTATFGIQPHMMEWTMKFGFGLQNSNANIKRIEERIRLNEKKEEAKEQTGGQKELYKNDYCAILLNYDIDRIQILTKDKPKPEIIEALKKAAFKYAPSQKAWQRQYTNNAMYSTKILISKINELI